MAYILDGAVILIVLFCVWNGWRKGFIKALSRLLAFVLALVAAMLLSTPIAAYVYDSTVSPTVQEVLTENLMQTGATTITQSVDTALTDMPGFVRNLLSHQGITSGADVVGKLSIGNSDTMTAVAQQIDTVVIRPVTVALLRVLSFLILFIVVSVIAGFLLRLLDKVFKLPLLRGINRTLGFIPGIINGVLCALLLTTVVQVWASMGSADGFITREMLSDTVLLQWLISVNPVGNTLQELTILPIK